MSHIVGLNSIEVINKLLSNLLLKHSREYRKEGLPLSIYTMSKILNNKFKFEGVKKHHIKEIVEHIKNNLEGGGIDDLSGFGIGETITNKVSNIVKGVKEHFKKHGGAYKKAGISVGVALATALAGKYMKNKYDTRQRNKRNEENLKDFEYEAIDLEDLGELEHNQDVNIPLSQTTTLGLSQGQIARRPFNEKHAVAIEHLGLPLLNRFNSDNQNTIRDIMNGKVDNFNDVMGRQNRERTEIEDRTLAMRAIASPQFVLDSDIGQFQPSELWIPKEVVGEQRDFPTRTLARRDTNAHTDAIRDYERDEIQRQYDLSNSIPRGKYDDRNFIDGRTMLSKNDDSEIETFLGELGDESKVFKGRQNITNQSLLNPSRPIYDDSIQSTSRIRAMGAKDRKDLKKVEVKGVGTNEIKLPARQAPPKGSPSRKSQSYVASVSSTPNRVPSITRRRDARRGRESSHFVLPYE
tara:strand:+ start:1988 stop:3382 length:1395 start_codon:yes stop_codon:yes gene_type:complete